MFYYECQRRRYIGYRGFPRGHRTHTVSAYFRRWLRRALLFLTTTPEVPVLLSEVQSGVLHLLGLISGVRRGGKGIPISSLVVEMDLLLFYTWVARSRSGSSSFTACCFVLLIPTPEEYRVPRVNPGVTASKLFPPVLPSLATPGPPLPYRPLQKARYYYPRFRVSFE